MTSLTAIDLTQPIPIDPAWLEGAGGLEALVDAEVRYSVGAKAEYC